MASQQSVSKVDATQLLAVAAVSIFIPKPCCWLSQSMNGKIMRKNSLMWGGLCQNKGRESKTWHTLTPEGLRAGGQLSRFSFKGKDKGPAVEEKK